jgi:transposase-like protein
MSKTEDNEDQDIKTKRWSAKRKLEIVLRLMRGESIDNVSREIGVEVWLLDEWKRTAFQSMEAGFKNRTGDPLDDELSRAKQRIGELSMENELLKEKSKKQGPLALRRWKL